MIASLTPGRGGSAPRRSGGSAERGDSRPRRIPADFAVMVVENKVAKARRVSLGPTFGDVLAVTAA